MNIKTGQKVRIKNTPAAIDYFGEAGAEYLVYNVDEAEICSLLMPTGSIVLAPFEFIEPVGIHCECGAEKVYGNHVSILHHSLWCPVRNTYDV